MTIPFFSENICVVAGEPSGDAQGALLVQELKKDWVNIEFWGATGPHLKKAGVKTLVDIDDLCVFGVTELIPKFIKISQCYKKILNEIKIKKPKALVLIDYPGFNLRLLKDAYHLGITTIYHIPPKAWSHGKSRTSILKKYAYLVTSILPFEVDFFKENKVNIKFIGNPLKNLIDEFMLRNPVQKEGSHIALLPGSRENEIKKLLPLLLESFIELEKIKNNLTAHIPLALNVSKPFFNSLLSGIKKKLQIDENWFQRKIKIEYGNAYDVLNFCDYAWVCSGTAALEAAFFAIPMSVVYKTSPFTYYLAKKFLTIKYISLVNLCKNQEVIPEFVQEQATTKNLIDHALQILNNKEIREKMTCDLCGLKSLFPPDAVAHGVREIKNCLAIFQKPLAEKFHLHSKMIE